MPATYLAPGVYIEEVDSGPKPIEGVGTAVAAFVGFAAAGEVNKVTQITNWTQYVDAFGKPLDPNDPQSRKDPHRPGAYLSHAVYGYFLNGGGRAYVVNIAPDTVASNGNSGGDTKQIPAAETPPPPQLQVSGASSKGGTSLTFTPKPDVTQDVQVQITAPDAGSPEGTFTVSVSSGTTQEVYKNVGLSKTGDIPAVSDAINPASKLVTVDANQAKSAVPPATGSYLIEVSQALATTAKMNLPQVNANNFSGSVADRSGVNGLEIAEDVTMVCCPDIMAAYEANLLDGDGVKAAQMAIINHCENMGDRMAILDPLPGLNPQQVATWRSVDMNFDSKYAALYYPWISIQGPDGQPMDMPPSGHMAGIWARNDTTRGVHKAPANEIISGGLKPVSDVTKGEQEVLNPIGVNCIRSFTGRGLRVWGARTLSSDAAWRYINVRRLFNFVEKSIEQGTQWVVFEPNDETLWAQVRRDTTAFLMGVWRDGALFGSTPAQAFYVKCDEELNPSDVRDRGQLFIEIGMAPVKPAEFVIFRLSQWSGGGA